MIERTVFACIAGLSLMSCATVNAKQPATLEEIAGFTPVHAGSGGSYSASGGKARQHLGPVHALARIPGTGDFFSGGKDGFISLHKTDGNDETWQISDIPVRNLAVHPDGNLVAVYESDGFSIYRISVWDWNRRIRIYAKRFRDSILSLDWSARGTYLMIGNTSLEGMTILDGETGENRSLFASPPGIVSLGVTGATETSMITYGPSGRILYTDMVTKKERASYTGESDLSAPALFANNLRLAGYRDGEIRVVDTTSGKTVASWPTGKPVMAVNQPSAEPQWFEEKEDGIWCLRSGPSASLPFTLPAGSSITTALHLDTRIIFGTTTGLVFAIDPGAGDMEAPEPSLLVDSTPASIDDIASDGSRLFILYAGSLFISSGPGRAPVFAFDGILADRLALMENSLVFWSAAQANPVLKQDFDGQNRTELWLPKEGIRSLAVNGSVIAFIEGNSQATVIDTASAQPAFTYSGAGLQDVIPLSAERIIVSKSSTVRSPNPLLLITIKTGETVPLPVSGDLCFGIRQEPDKSGTFTGFLIKQGTVSSSTELITVSLDPDYLAATSVKIEAVYADEDLSASVLGAGDRIITNLGKGSLVSIDANGKQARFVRGYALPQKAASMEQFFVSLNHDGSVTWFGRDSLALISTAFITGSGLWAED